MDDPLQEMGRWALHPPHWQGWTDIHTQHLAGIGREHRGLYDNYTLYHRFAWPRPSLLGPSMGEGSTAVQNKTSTFPTTLL
jgi:hypothetical protein